MSDAERQPYFQEAAEQRLAFIERYPLHWVSLRYRNRAGNVTTTTRNHTAGTASNNHGNVNHVNHVNQRTGPSNAEFGSTSQGSASTNGE